MPVNSSTSNFKKSLIKSNLIIIIKLLIFLMLFLPSITYVGNKYKYASSLNKINDANQKRFTYFYKQPKNSIDLVFLGSSHSYCSFDPAIFDYELNVNSFQMGMPLQHPDNSYYTLLEVLNYQRPKTIVLEFYWDLLSDDFELKQTEMLLKVLKNDKLKEDMVKNLFPLNEKVKYDIPVIRYQKDYLEYKNKEIKNKIQEKINYKIPPVKGAEFITDKGFIFSDFVIPEESYDKKNQFNNYDVKGWKFSDVQKKYIYKIIELAKQYDIKLYFVTAPIANVSLEKIPDYEIIHNQISDFLKENNVKYLDFNVPEIHNKLFKNENFRDDAHLNYSGSTIASKYLANWIKEDKN